MTAAVARPLARRRGADVLAFAGIAAATAATLALARAHPAGAFAGRSPLGDAIELAAAVGLGGAGVLVWRQGARGGLLILAAGALWLLDECTNPDIGFAPLFTLGLAGAFAPVPVVTQLALSRMRPAGRVPRATVVALSCTGIVALGAVPALSFDPQAQGCLTCPHNLLLVDSNAALFADLSRWGIRIALATTAVSAGTIVAHALRSSRAALAAWGPLLAAAVLYLALVCADLWHSASRAVLSNDPTDVALWRAQGAALVVLALALVRGALRVRRTRTAMAALVVELGATTRIGGARDKLAEALGDPTVALAYRRAAGEGYVTLDGAPAAHAATSGRASTPLVRDDGREIAVAFHDERLLVVPGLAGEAVAAARLAVENEQLRAELNAQAREIRDSRARIVHEGDGARRRLERDLHDGAQQRLVSLSLALRLLEGRARSHSVAASLAVADARLREALAELRDIAHGIYPASLGDEGLAAALEDLAERTAGSVVLAGLPRRRVPAAVEQAAYFAVAELVEDGPARVAIRTVDDGMEMSMERTGPVSRLAERITEITDRVGALNGTVATETAPDGGVAMRAWFPCA